MVEKTINTLEKCVGHFIEQASIPRRVENIFTARRGYEIRLNEELGTWD